MKPATAILIASLTLAGASPAQEKPPSPYFGIHVVDGETGRGVPLVELRTVNEIRYVTDSAGWIALHEPGLMGREVFFHVASDGYEHPADGFGMRGVRLVARPGESATLRLERRNIAERLYRVTGGGIYRDSILLGHAAPLREPLLNARVLGQDSVQSAVHRGRIWWLWGDTSRASYPLGNFATSGATSKLPDEGGLDPGIGVDLEYFTDAEGFTRRMMPLEAPGMVWMDALLSLEDESGQPRLLAHYARMKSLGERLEHGLATFDEEGGIFERSMRFDDDAMLHPQGHAFEARGGDRDFIYFACPFPVVRVEATWASVTNPDAYEAFTCLEPPAGDPAADSDPKAPPRVARDADGRAVWGWMRGAPFLDPAREKKYLDAGQLENEDLRFQLRDVESGESVVIHRASVAWNEYRERWILIGEQIGGRSLLGEIWYAEAREPHGPWKRAIKVVTHSAYSFYNPRHHPFFDREGGRLIYFEGTYSRLFTNIEVPTPRYDYNQVMYRLDLADPRLAKLRAPGE